MAKTNFQYEKRQKDLEKKRKKEEKLKKKADKASQPDGTVLPDSEDSESESVTEQTEADEEGKKPGSDQEPSSA